MQQKEIVFYKPWFKRNQKLLLKFANTFIGKFILRIYGKRSSVGKNKIIKIEPHVITWENPDGSFSAEFRTHAKFAKRLYYGLKPLWKIMHFWDTTIANTFIPELNLGFDTLTEYPDPTGLYFNYYPDSGTDDSSYGSITWSDPSNITLNDGNCATATTNGTDETHYLKATDCGFNISDSYQVIGVVVDIERHRSGGSTGEIQDSVVKLVLGDGSIGSENKASDISWATSVSLSEYGGYTDLWGEVTRSDVNSSNFGVVLSAKGDAGSDRVANVDYVRIVVTYRPADASTCDGHVQNYGFDYSTVRSASSGTGLAGTTAAGMDVYTSKIGSVYSVYRSFFLFDTSSLSGSQINSATVSTYGWITIDSADSVDIDVVSSSPASNTELVVDDYDEVGSTLLSDTEIAIADISTSSYNDWSLNSSGLSNISFTSISKFAHRSSFDINNTTPTDHNRYTARRANNSGTTKDPKLVVNYTYINKTLTCKGDIKKTIGNDLTCKGNITKTITYNKTTTTKAHIQSCKPAKTTLVSPVHQSEEATPITFIWEIPTDCKSRNVHAHIQVDGTDNTFGDLEENLFSYRDSDFEYWNGAEWIEYPTAGVTSTYYGNQARITLSLTNGTKYWRVRGGVK